MFSSEFINQPATWEYFYGDRESNCKLSDDWRCELQSF